MITTHFNLFDAGVIGVIVLSCLFAFFRGFIREILSLAGWIGAGLITLCYFPKAAALFAPHFKNPAVAGGLGALTIYVVALIGFSIISMIIMKFVKSGNEMGLIDNFFGLFFGVFRGVFIVCLAFLLANTVLEQKEPPEWMKTSVTRPYVEKGAILLAKAAPDYLDDIKALQKKMEDKMHDSDDADTSDTGKKIDEYSKETKARLQRLMDNAEQGQ